MAWVGGRGGSLTPKLLGALSGGVGVLERKEAVLSKLLRMSRPSDPAFPLLRN